MTDSLKKKSSKHSTILELFEMIHLKNIYNELCRKSHWFPAQPASIECFEHVNPRVELYLQGLSLRRLLCCVCACLCLELQLCSRRMMVMDESCSLPERGTELNWKVLLIPPVTASESSLLEIDLSQGGLCGKKAAISSWWEGMIRFVLSLFFPPLLESANHISSLPCQHALLVEQSKLICRRATWYFSSYFPRYPVSLSSCLSAEMFWH